jgi:predicted nucleotidyltransferase
VASVSAQLPEAVRTTLSEFTAAAQQAFAEDLLSVVLFGSAAEGRLRATSDVNVVLVLRHVDPKKLETIGEAYQFAHAAIRLSAMFILETEISVAKDAFAVKFADIIARHEVLYGPDPFVGLSVSREAALHRLLQVLVDLQLRLRERYALSSAYDEQLATAAADAVGPLRPAPRYCCGSNRERGLRPATHCGRSRTRPAARPPSPLSARRARAVAYRQSGPRLRSSARSNSRRDLQSGQSKSSSPEN